MDDKNFYKHKAWKALEDDIREIKDSQSTFQADITKRVNKIDKKLTRIIAYASGVAAGVSVVFMFAKEVLMWVKGK